MTKNTDTLQYKRRRQGRTNYAKRLELLKSRKPRVVIRKTNTDIIVQIIAYDPDGDEVLASASASELTDLGWTFATANTPAAYLAGLLAGTKAKQAGVSEAIVDLGMQKAKPKGVLFAAAQGVRKAGLSVPLSDDVLVSDKRLKGEHMDESCAALVEKLEEKIGA